MRFKKFTLATLVLTCSALLTGCAELNGFVQFSSPMAQSVGFRSQEQAIMVTNTTQLVGDMVAFGKKFGEIYPNETVVAATSYEPLGQNQIPFAIVFHDSEGRYSGVATRTLDVGSYAQSTSWIVREGDVVRFGERLNKPAVSAPVYAPASRRVKLPREWFNGTTWKQFVNDGRSELRIVVNGQPRANIKTGEVYALQARMLYERQTQPVMITIFGFAPDGRQAGTYETQLWPQNSGVSASQEVLSPGSLRYQ